MGLFRPTALKPGLADLSPELFRQLGVSAVLLDVDNTIASYTSHQPIPGAVEWARAMTQAGFRLIIVSNNFKKRVGPFAAKFGLDFISFACKPCPGAISRPGPGWGCAAGSAPSWGTRSSPTWWGRTCAA